MAQENETPKCSRNNGGGSGGKAIGRPSKKPKPKKVPQRGLGVAQLEKIRLEEEQATKSSHDLHLPQIWSSHEAEFDKERLEMDSGWGFVSSLPCESDLIRPLPNWVQRTQFPSSSMVSASSGTSSTPVPHSSIEPPSNQNSSLNYAPMKPEKMMGIKRPNPFSLDVPPVPSFNCKPPIFPAPMKASETISCGNGSGSGFNVDVGNSTLREVPSFSESNSAHNSKKSYNENENLSGGFLTLAPPTLISCSNSKLKSPNFLALHQGHPYLESLLSQEIKEDQIPPSSGYNQFNQQHQHLYNFFPPAPKVEQIKQTSDRFQSCNAVGENVDLNLKL